MADGLLLGILLKIKRKSSSLFLFSYDSINGPADRCAGAF